MSSFITTGGQTIPTTTESQVRDAIRLADRAHQGVGDGGGWDDSRLRTHLTARAKAHGIPHIVPATWTRSGSAKSVLAKSAGGGQWSDTRLLRETREAVYGVAKRAGCKVHSMDIEMITPAEAAAALSKAFDYRQMADRLTDRASADGYRALAKKTLQEAGLA